jgi:hypothetical protein
MHGTYICQTCGHVVSLDPSGPAHTCVRLTQPLAAPFSSGPGMPPPTSFPIRITTGSDMPDAWIDQLSDDSLDRLAARVEQRMRQRQHARGGN